MTLRIISSEEVVFEGDATVVRLPGSLGAFTVLPGHASLISTLTAGNIEYVTGDGELSSTIAGGIVDIDRDVVSVCIY